MCVLGGGGGGRCVEQFATWPQQGRFNVEISSSSMLFANKSLSSKKGGPTVIYFEVRTQVFTLELSLTKDDDEYLSKRLVCV